MEEALEGHNRSEPRHSGMAQGYGDVTTDPGAACPRSCQIIYSKQGGNVSFGRYPDGGPDWAFMTAPTPGAPNTQAFAGAVEDISFSVEHGFFTEPFTVTLTTDKPDAQIWYTLDSTTPCRNADGQFEAILYDRAIPVDGTTVIRAVAVKPEWKDSTLSSRTYIFFSDAQWQVYNASEDFFALSGEDHGQTDPSEGPGDEPIDPNLEHAYVYFMEHHTDRKN